MATSRTWLVDEIFLGAVDRPPAERAAFLADRCGDDAALRREVEALLRHDDAVDDSFLGGRDVSVADDIPSDLQDGAVGHFRIVRLIGEGGFGVVYLAEQTEPVRRAVALKVVKLGMDTKQIVARFEAERQSLAMMDHPSIAKVFEAGATERGRPYFAMEHVAGSTVIDFCDAERLTNEQRLRLFLDVCDAVAHAHQKGVIHRDLKPSNILVARVGERIVPKVIDFGIARAIGPDLVEQTLTMATEQGQLIGTPEYMSPEQAEGRDLDTRTDVYSLGVVLYHLVTGVLPFEPEAYRSKPAGELQRMIRDAEPARPSTRLASLGAGTVQVAARRRTDPRSLARELRGDLDWITMKAMAKERERRYASVLEMAADVRRYLAHEPVLAGPPSTAYRVRKFVRRNRGLVASAAVVALVLVGGVAGSTSGWIRAHGSAAEASAAKTRAQDEAERARNVTAYLVEVLSIADPAIALSADVSVRDLLDHASATVSDAFRDEPDAEAVVRTVYGRAYYSLGDLDQARTQLRRALDLWEGSAEPNPEEHYRALATIAAIEGEDPVVARGLPTSRKLEDAAIRVVAPSSADLASLMAEVAMANRRPLYRLRAADLRHMTSRADGLLPPGHRHWPVYAEFVAHVGTQLVEVDPVLARAALEEAYRVFRRETPAEDPRAAAALAWLVPLRLDAGEVEGAEQLARAALDGQIKVLGDDHWMVAASRSLLGSCLLAQERFAEAEPMLVDSYETLATLRGRDTLVATRAQASLIELYDRTGRRNEADRHRRTCVEQMIARGGGSFAWRETEAVLGPERRELVATIHRLRKLAAPHEATAERDRAFAEAADEYVRLRAALVPSNDPMAALLSSAMLFVWLPNWAHYTPWVPRAHMARDCAEVLEQWGEQLPRALAGAKYISAKYATDDDLKLRLYREALAIAETCPDMPPQNPPNALMSIAAIMAGRGDYEEAERYYLEALAALEAICADTDSSLEAARLGLTNLYGHWGKPERSAAILMPCLRRAMDQDYNIVFMEVTAWLATRYPGEKPEVYRLARRLAKRACELAPDNATCHALYGAACYRSGDPRQALDAIARSEALFESSDMTGFRHANGGFAAMSLATLGRYEEAVAALQRQRDALEAARDRRVIAGWLFEQDEKVLDEAERVLGAQ